MSISFLSPSIRQTATVHRILTVSALRRSATLRGGMMWPKHFPSGCPEPEAIPADGIVWRIVKADTPTADDFVSHKLTYPAKNWGKSECQACGLSVHRNRADALGLLALPRFRGYHVASGTLAPAHGVIRSTPTAKSESHETWWVPQGVEVWTLFAVSDEADEGGES
jgi:hypothetical protein